MKLDFVSLQLDVYLFPNKPDFQGLENFKGQLLQTSSWPQEEQDFTGKRVAIIGTGSSAIQSIPLIAEQAEVLYVFQRTPNYSIPSNNGPMDKSVEKDVKSKKVKKIDKSSLIGEILAKRAKEKNISNVYFDRGEYKYHGRVKVFAETLRKNGLKF